MGSVDFSEEMVQASIISAKEVCIWITEMFHLLARAGRLILSPIRLNEYLLSVVEFLDIELELKYGSTSFVDWLWSVIAPALGFKTIPDALDEFSHIHTQHNCDYVG